MGRIRKYATPEEAHEAKKKQMRENYQKRKAAKQEATKRKEEEEIPEKLKAKPRKPKRQAANTIEEAVIDIVNDNPANMIHMSKEDLLTKVLTAVGEALA